MMQDSGEEEEGSEDAASNAAGNKQKGKRVKETADNQFGLVNYYTKKIILKIWGFYNERFKQCWEKYVTSTTTSGGLYLCTAILIEIMCKYISRKKVKMMENDKDDSTKKETNNKRNSGGDKPHPVPEVRKSR
jgi:hypothetical protein